jgi:hypothetical protein
MSIPRLISIGLPMAALLLSTAQPVTANVYLGRIKTVFTNAIVVTTSRDKKDHTLAVDKKTRVYLDGKPAKLGDLSAGLSVVANGQTIGAKLTATSIFARSAAGANAGAKGDALYSGMIRVINLRLNNIVVYSAADKKSRTFLIRPGAPVTLNGKAARLADLKVGLFAEVTSSVIGGLRYATAIAAATGRR